jgi:2-iminobutanoate/2-iminopropanoate deaminase
MNRSAVFTDHAPAALGPYSQAIVAGGFVSAPERQESIRKLDPSLRGSRPKPTRPSKTWPPFSTRRASMTDLVKTTIFYSDVADFATLNEVYARHIPDPPPARSAPAKVRLPHGLLVSIEAIAALPS